jgi:hypothetical protein
MEHPVQGHQPLTKEEREKVNLRRWLDEKRLRDAERAGREGMQGYRA